MFTLTLVLGSTLHADSGHINYNAHLCRTLLCTVFSMISWPEVNGLYCGSLAPNKADYASLTQVMF